jgi:hypothetical protein
MQLDIANARAAIPLSQTEADVTTASDCLDARRLSVPATKAERHVAKAGVARAACVTPSQRTVTGFTPHALTDGTVAGRTIVSVAGSFDNCALGAQTTMTLGTVVLSAANLSPTTIDFAVPDAAIPADPQRTRSVTGYLNLRCAQKDTTFPLVFDLVPRTPATIIVVREAQSDTTETRHVETPVMSTTGTPPRTLFCGPPIDPDCTIAEGTLRIVAERDSADPTHDLAVDRITPSLCYHLVSTNARKTSKKRAWHYEYDVACVKRVTRVVEDSYAIRWGDRLLIRTNGHPWLVTQYDFMGRETSYHGPWIDEISRGETHGALLMLTTRSLAEFEMEDAQ